MEAAIGLLPVAVAYSAYLVWWRRRERRRVRHAERMMWHAALARHGLISSLPLLPEAQVPGAVRADAAGRGRRAEVRRREGAWFFDLTVRSELSGADHRDLRCVASILDIDPGAFSRAVPAELVLHAGVLSAPLSSVRLSAEEIDALVSAAVDIAGGLRRDDAVERLVAAAAASPDLAARAAALTLLALSDIAFERYADAARQAVDQAWGRLKLAGAVAMLVGAGDLPEGVDRSALYEELAAAVDADLLRCRAVPLLIEDAQGRDVATRAALAQALDLVRRRTDDADVSRTARDGARALEAGLHARGEGQLALAVDVAADEGALSVVGDNDGGAAVRLVSRDSGGGP